MKKAIKISCIACLFILILAIFTINHYIFRCGYGMPDGEIDFIGLSKEEVKAKIIKDNLFNDIAIDGYIWQKLDYPRIMNSDKWGVNRKDKGIKMYTQLLYFNNEGKVYKQELKISSDGP